MSQTVSLRLPNEIVDRLDRFARTLGNGTTRSRATVILIDEGLREEEFTGIEFRNTSVGRQPYVMQTGMAVWEIVMVARRFDFDAERTALHLECPAAAIRAALSYYDAYRSDIDQALQDNEIGEARLRRAFPNLKVIEVPADSDAAAS